MRSVMRWFIIPISTVMLFDAAACKTRTENGDTSGTEQTPTSHAATDTGLLNTMLSDLWVTDGRHGYFMDSAWNGSDHSFSLYDTYWNLKLGSIDKTNAPKLNPESVYKWVRFAIEGNQPTSSLPQIAQISYSFHTLRLLQMKPDVAAVSKSLESLRQDGLYAASANAPGSWGSTAQAVGVLTSIGKEPPQIVADNVRRTLLNPVDREPEDQIKTVIPALETAISLQGAGLPKGLIVRRLHEASQALGNDYGSIWLGAQASLRDIASWAKVEPPPVPAVACEKLVRPNGTITVNGSLLPDPQLTYYGYRVGCRTTKKPVSALYARSGWPRIGTIESLQTSLAGLRVAQLIKHPDTARIESTLATTMFEVWLPSYQRMKSVSLPAKLSVATRIQSLASALRLGNRVDLPIPDFADIARNGDNELPLLVLLDTIAHNPDLNQRDTIKLSISRLIGAHPRPSTMFGVASLELGSRLLGKPSLHQDAVDATPAFRNADGTLRMTRESTRTSSMSAETLGTWILGSTISFESWEQLGLCPQSACHRATAAPKQDFGFQLQAIAALYSCRRSGCGSDLPIVL